MDNSVTARLSALKHKLSDCRHGGIVLTGDDLEAFIAEVEDLRRQTLRLEFGVPRSGRFYADLGSLVDDRSAAVLDAMRPDSNVIAHNFRREN